MKVAIREFASEVLGIRVHDTNAAVAMLARWKIPTEAGEGKKLFRKVNVEFLEKAKAAYAKEQAADAKRANGHGTKQVWGRKGFKTVVNDPEIGRKLDIISSELAALTKWLHEREARILTTKAD